MKKSWAVLLVGLAACQPAAEQATVEDAAAAPEAAPVKAVLFEGTALGEPLTLEYLTPVSAILASPDRYVGQRVLVEGVVTGVCQEQGCWMNIVGGEGGDTIQIKVDDGVIVFPQDAVGRKALAEGTVEKVDPTDTHEAEHAAHHPEEQAAAEQAAAPAVSYRIRGLGVRIAP